AYVGHAASFVATYRFVPAANASPSPSPSPSPSSSPEPDFGPPEQTTYRRGLLYHEIDRSQGVSVEAGFDGHAYWTSNENRFSVNRLEDAARRAITVNAVDADTFDDSANVQARDPQTIDGVRTDVVRVTPRGGIPADLAIDRATGAFVQVTFDPDGERRSVTHIVGYTEIAPGVRIPSGYRYGRSVTYTLLQGSVRPVTDEELARPSPSAVWTFGGGEPVRIELARATYGGHAVMLRASINGTQGTFLLDSGAGGVLLYRPYADKLGLAMLGRTGYTGINGGFRGARFARAGTIAVGDNVLRNVILSVAARYPGDRDPIDGILGYDVLAGALVHVDLVKEIIEFADPAHTMATVAKGGFAFPVNLADGTPEIRLKVAGVDTRATFDTGNDFFAIFSDHLTRTGQVVGLRAGAIYFGGVDGIANEPSSCYNLREILVGPYRYQNVMSCFGNERVFGRDGGLIGFDFLRHFDWTFDYSRSHLILTPNGR
nr:retroviral-like aspartic protease family protein [Candidatus Eremiobacteraeota bacterium]